MTMPNDPVMLLSFVNLKLRDECSSLADFCNCYQVDDVSLREKLASIDYEYDPNTNQFI